jgi:hypothetical protein
MDRLFDVAKAIWYEPYLTKSVADDIFSLLEQHRYHSDTPWWTTLPEDSSVYVNLFKDKPDYRWLLDPSVDNGVNVTVFNLLLKHKKNNIPINWKLFKQLIWTAARERSGNLSKDQANVIVADAVEAVHPSGIQDVLNKD